MTRTGSVARPDFDDRTEGLMEWAEAHSRHLTIAAVAIVVLAGAGWFYAKSRQVQARNASAALSEAELALTSGNLPLAQSSLQQVVSRYGGTPSGNQARLLLAQVMFDDGRYQEGLAQLQPVVASGDKLVLASAQNLIGAGYEQSGKLVEAAQAYQKAADAAASPAERDTYLASAARALTDAGKSAEARVIWQRLADDPSSPAAAEARVRLGELEVKPAKAG